MGIGVNARTAFSLFFPPILDEFGWDRGVTAGAFSFGFVVSAVLSPSLGRLMDRRGPRVVIEIGVGSIILLPWLSTLIGRAGWRAACWAMGLLVLGLLAPLNLLLKKRPEDLGLEPDGDRS